MTFFLHRYGFLALLAFSVAFILVLVRSVNLHQSGLLTDNQVLWCGGSALVSLFAFGFASMIGHDRYIDQRSGEIQKVTS